MIFGLKPEVIERICAVFEKYMFIEEAVLYGSRAKGNFKVSSDIDIALKGKQIELPQVAQISVELDDLLLPFKIDLTVYDKIKNTELTEHIDRVGKTIYNKKINVL